MARKKGATKTKTAGRKSASDAKQTDKKDDNVKDDPGGKLPPAMEITNSCNESKTTLVSQQHTKPISTNPPPPAVVAAAAAAAPATIENSKQISVENSSNSVQRPPSAPAAPLQQTASSVFSSNTNCSDLKYLHKKFKRIASATLSNDSGSESTTRQISSTTAPNSSVANSSSVTSSSGTVTSTFIVTTSAISLPKPQPPSIQQQSQQQQQEQPTTPCAKGGDLVSSYAAFDENYSRLQLTSLSSEHSNGASLNRANDISSGSNSFISNNNNNNHHHIPSRESEDFKSYHPSVNKNSAFNISCALNEKSQCSQSNSGSGGSSSATGVLSTAAATKVTTTTTTTSSSSSSSAVDSIQTAIVSYENSSVTSGSTVVSVGHLNFGTQPPYEQTVLSQQVASATLIGTTSSSSNTPGRYVCPFCQMNCSKPSVLQKHIRRHTNERPFRCDPCGIAFKTKSNLYKHCRSRAHASKSQGEDIGPVIDEDGSLGGSDIDDKELSNSGSDIINRGSPMDDRVYSPQLLVEKPYKPKFHNAALYTKFDAKTPCRTTQSTVNSGSTSSAVTANHSAPSTSHYLNGQNVESLEQHISKLISDNEAIVDVVEPPLQKKYHKITGITRGISVSSSSSSSHVNHEASSGSSGGSKLANALLQKRMSEEVALQQAQISIPFASGSPNEHLVINVSPSKPIVSAKPVAIINQVPIQVQYPLQMPNHSIQMMIRPPVGSEPPPTVQYQQPLNLSKPIVQNDAVELVDHSRKRTSEVLYYPEQSPSSPAVQQYQHQQPIVIHAPQTLLQVPAVHSQPQVPLQQSSPQPQPAQQQTQQPPQQQPQPTQQQAPVTVTEHPQNPERSIIKDLLLNSREFGVVQNPDSENTGNLYTCKSCNIIFRDPESLKYHTICHCQGNSSNLNSPSSAPISPVGSPSAHLMRSKSSSDRFNPTSLKTLARVSLNPPPRNPSTLSKLAKSQLKHPRGRPENIPLQSSSSSGGSSSANESHLSTAIPAVAKIVDVVQNPLPSPGPLLGNTRLVEFQSSKNEPLSSKASEAGAAVTQIAPPDEPPLRKRSIIITEGVNPDQQLSLRRIQHPNMQLFGGEVEVVDRNEEIIIHRYTSGGTVTQFSSNMDSEMLEPALAARSGMHSGGTIQQLPKAEHRVTPAPINPATPKLIVTITPSLTPSLTTPNLFTNQQVPQSDNSSSAQGITHFHFPPINSITAYNPLTLPPQVTTSGQATQIMHAGKLIPYVQGIPGPNTMVASSDLPPKTSPRILASPNLVQQPVIAASSVVSMAKQASSSLPITMKPVATFAPMGTLILEGDERNTRPFLMNLPAKNGLTKEIWSPAKQDHLQTPRKSFNFTRIADNISPRKKESTEGVKKEEVRYFNFENFISKSEILTKSLAPVECKPEPMESSSKASSEAGPQPAIAPVPPPRPKFLRPNSLPLKPGTFTPKRHHGITPTHNTMPLISPETPRPSKSCRELYFNGHAYTNIGLKSSTKPFYCTVNKTQPFYVHTQKQLSMYSNWQVHPESDPHPLGLSAIAVISMYDSSQQRDRRYTIASMPLALATVNSGSSTHAVVTPAEVKTNFPAYSVPPTTSPNSGGVGGPQALKHAPQSGSAFSPFLYQEKGASNDSMPPRSESTERTLSGGFESTEEYTYVRGRGRGKYVCNECGIRCKKPSMLKKHIRTHTDVRPYSCQYCSFHFKTKGNLTKHMKSKSHYKKCTELGLNPIPTSVDDDGGDIDIEGDQQSISSERTSTIPGDSDTGSESDGEDSDDSDESKSRLPEHEAAHCLLSLSMTPPTGSQCSKSYPSPGPYSTSNHQLERGRLVYGPVPTLSPPAGMTVVQTQPHQIGQQPPHPPSSPHAETSQPNRRIITFANTPKVEFNLLKHEQYYSDPNLSKKKPVAPAVYEDDGAMPIDLTKKTKEPQYPVGHEAQHIAFYHHQHHQLAKSSNVLMQPQHVQLPSDYPSEYSVPGKPQVIVRVSDVVTPITGTANLLTTLVSNTDKIPLANNLISNGTELVDDNNVYFQEYIKQRALQDSKMKQSQMKGINNNQYENIVVLQSSKVVSPILPAELPPVSKATDKLMQGHVPAPTVTPAVAKLPSEKTYRIFNGKNELPARVVTDTAANRLEILPIAKDPAVVYGGSQENVISKEPSPAEPNTSRMDTLADVAIGNFKADSSETMPGRAAGNNVKSNEPQKPTPSAVLQASAAPLSKESAKSVASEYLKLTQRKREDSESGGTASDQETLVEPKLIPAPAIVAPLVPPVVVVPTTNPAATGEIGGIVARTVVVGEDGFKTTPTASDFPTLGHFQDDGGRPVCEICNKKFHKSSQLKIHMNIHYMERKFRCEPCGTSFRSQGLFLKHERSATHRNKVSMTTTFGIATDSNPRPFYCKDCDVGFRIHGHLAKHLRSKMHVLKLECLGKLPFGTYTEIERSGTNLTEIDTTDCENSLSSLKRLAVRLNVKDPANVLPGNGGVSDALPSGNETDSCDDNQYENDNESNVDDSPSSNGPANKDEDDDPDTGSEAAMLVGNCHTSASEGTDSASSLTSLANNNNNNNINATHLKRKPDDSSTSSNSSSTNEGNGGGSSSGSSSIGGGEPKRAKFQTASELGTTAGPGES